MSFTKSFNYILDELRFGKIRHILQTKSINSCTIEEFLWQEERLPKDVNIIKMDDNIIKYPLVELDIPFLCSLTKAKDPELVFEIGTGLGLSSKCFLSNMNGGQVVSLDLRNRNKLVNDKRLKQFFANSKYFNYKPYYNKVDLFFIDGSHKRSYVMSDSCNALHCIKDDGYIIWHDFHSDFLGSVSAILDFICENNLSYYKIKGTWMAIAWKKNK